MPCEFLAHIYHSLHSVCWVQPQLHSMLGAYKLEQLCAYSTSLSISLHVIKKPPDLYFCFFWSGDNWDRAPLNMTVICLHPFLSLHLPHFLKTLTRQLKHGFSQITFTQRLMRHNQFLSLQCPGGQWQKDIRICCRQAAIEPASHCQLHWFFFFP